MKVRAWMAAAGLLVAGITVVTASPASAAAPVCTGFGIRIGKDANWNVRTVEVYFPAHSPDTRVWHPYSGAQMGNGFWSCSMQRGTRTEAVRRLQITLNQCYQHVTHTTLEEDGDFGSLTKAALVKVQQHHGISADGQYGPQTARTITHGVGMWDIMTGKWSFGCAPLSWAGWPGDSG